jgi:MGT family glycosyltransferase
MVATGGDLAAAGPLLQASMGAWAREVSEPVAALISRDAPSAVITSLFGVEVVADAAPPCRWAVVNSTFYIGPSPPRPVEQDIGPRAVPLVTRYAALLGSADLVLHATDRVFDFGFAGLPPRHHYVGPLGIWEPASEPPPYLDEPGDPWVLVTISSQLGDDLPLAETALEALASMPLRVVLTIGPGHDPGELKTRPPNARIEKSIPHSAVLERGRLLVSHAGHGSVMKALWHGTPMVLVPWGRDQPGVAARAQALGVAEVVPREVASVQTLAAGITRALSSTALRDAAATHAARLRAGDPPKLAASLVESLL